MIPDWADWANFFVAEVGAAAALSGLAAVAISINLSKILSYPSLPVRAAEMLLQMMSVFVLASVALAPKLPAGDLGALSALSGVAQLVYSARAQVLAWRDIHRPSFNRRIARYAMTFASLAPLVVGGVGLCAGWDEGIYWIASGMIASLVVGVWSAWVLLVEILR